MVRDAENWPCPRRDSLSSGSAQEICKPLWLDALVKERFFAGCSAHEAAKKSEKNICCLDCGTSICPHCLPSHRFHKLLQVRRYVYHDVVRLEDLEKLIDCSYVQSYTINSSKVVFIKKRPQSKQFRGNGNCCISCDRSLQEPYFHCSLGCKVEFLLTQKKDLSPCFNVAGEEDDGGGIMRRKRSSLQARGGGSMNRRKGIPHRSPSC